MKKQTQRLILLRVADRISKNPEQFSMNHWGTCIAGWMHRISPADSPFQDMSHGLSGLFYEDDWPVDFRTTPTDTAIECAAKAVRRIHAFLDDYAPGWRDAKEFAK